MIVTDKYWHQVVGIRTEVFVEEQGVPFVLEVDARDFRSSTRHLLLHDGDTPVATARILADADGNFHLGRIAVVEAYRGGGWGQKIVLAAIDQVRANLPAGKGARIVLDSQVQAVGFYEKCGFTLVDRPVFFDAGIPHREMGLYTVGHGQLRSPSQSH